MMDIMIMNLQNELDGHICKYLVYFFVKIETIYVYI